MKTKVTLRRSTRGKNRNSKRYRSSRERTSNGQSQTLWTLVVTIAFVLAALSQFKSGNRMSLYQEQEQASERVPAGKIVETKPVKNKTQVTPAPQSMGLSISQKLQVSLLHLDQ